MKKQPRKNHVAGTSLSLSVNFAGILKKNSPGRDEEEAVRCMRNGTEGRAQTAVKDRRADESKVVIQVQNFRYQIVWPKRMCGLERHICRSPCERRRRS
jgi:hypothetical protein